MKKKTVNQFKRSKNKINEKKNWNGISCDKTFSRTGKMYFVISHIFIFEALGIINNDFYLQSNAFTCPILYMSFVNEGLKNFFFLNFFKESVDVLVMILYMCAIVKNKGPSFMVH